MVARLPAANRTHFAVALPLPIRRIGHKRWRSHGRLLGLFVHFARQLATQTADARSLRDEIEGILQRGDALRLGIRQHLAALGAAIERQFALWNFTAAEQEVGFLLLKGFGHKEIAALRGASEATIRQQASSLYRKAVLSGRAGLSAHFLEQLLLPSLTPAVAPVSCRGRCGMVCPGSHLRSSRIMPTSPRVQRSERR